MGREGFVGGGGEDEGDIVGILGGIGVRVFREGIIGGRGCGGEVEKSSAGAGRGGDCQKGDEEEKQRRS